MCHNPILIKLKQVLRVINIRARRLIRLFVMNDLLFLGTRHFLEHLAEHRLLLRLSRIIFFAFLCLALSRRHKRLLISEFRDKSLLDLQTRFNICDLHIRVDQLLFKLLDLHGKSRYNHLLLVLNGLFIFYQPLIGFRKPINHQLELET